MFTTVSPVDFILNLATSQVMTVALDQFDPIIERLQDRIETDPAYAQLWKSLPADTRPELSRFCYRLTGLVNEAFLAGLVCAHVPQEK